MKNDAGCFFFTVGAIVVAGVGLLDSMTPQKTIPSTSDGMIAMVQPCGWPWCMEYDAHYAGNVNLPNSESNQNNGAAAESYADAQKTLSEASQIRQDERQDGFMFGLWTALMGMGITLGPLVIVGIVLLLIVKGIVR